MTFPADVQWTPLYIAESDAAVAVEALGVALLKCVDSTGLRSAAPLAWPVNRMSVDERGRVAVSEILTRAAGRPVVVRSAQ